MSRRSVSVVISGQEYEIVSDSDEQSLQRVAGYVDETMERIRKRTGAVDSLEVAMLTALNIARELVEARSAPEAALPQSELRGLIERVEQAVGAGPLPSDG
jgi:cell division protein ZapA